MHTTTHNFPNPAPHHVLSSTMALNLNPANEGVRPVIDSINGYLQREEQIVEKKQHQKPVYLKSSLGTYEKQTIDDEKAEAMQLHVLEQKLKDIEEGLQKDLKNVEFYKQKRKQEIYRQEQPQEEEEEKEQEIASRRESIMHNEDLKEKIDMIQELKQEHHEYSKQVNKYRSLISKAKAKSESFNNMIQKEFEKFHRKEAEIKAIQNKNFLKYQKSIQMYHDHCRQSLEFYKREHRLKQIFEQCLTNALDMFQERKSRKDESLYEDILSQAAHLREEIDKSYPFHPSAGAFLEEETSHAVRAIQAVVRGYQQRKYGQDFKVKTMMINDLNKFKEEDTSGNKKLKFSNVVHFTRIPHVNDWDDWHFDDCFYTSEEIADFRFNAFMEDCGLTVDT